MLVNVMFFVIKCPKMLSFFVDCVPLSVRWPLSAIALFDCIA